jgi:hypothetical protein
MPDLHLIVDNLDREDGGKIQKFSFELFGDLVSIGTQDAELGTVTLIELQSICAACQEFIDRDAARTKRLNQYF